MSAYPEVRTHGEVRCFKCSGDGMVNHFKTAYPPGEGQWAAGCPKCHNQTFYDLKEEKEDGRNEEV